MIDEREALRTLEAWFDKYSYLSEKSDYHFRLLSRVRNAILALGDYVKRTNALQIDNVRLQMEAELNEDWGERYAILLTALYAKADGATYRAVRAYETDVIETDKAFAGKIAVFETMARYREAQQREVKRTLMRRLNLDESEYFEYIIMRNDNE